MKTIHLELDYDRIRLGVGNEARSPETRKIIWHKSATSTIAGVCARAVTWPVNTVNNSS